MVTFALDSTKVIIVERALPKFTNSLIEPIEFPLINKKKFALVNQQDLLPQEQGIVVRDYGGMNGLKTLSINGSSSNQVSLLVNGFKLIDNANGTFDYNLVSIDDANSISLVNSGVSSLLGSNAMFGAIILNTTSNNNLELTSNIASFQTYRIGLKLPLKALIDNTSLTIDYLSSKNNFPFVLNEKGKEITLNRANSDINKLNISLSNQINNVELRINNYFNFISIERGISNAVISSNQDIYSKLEDNAFISTSNITYEENQLNLGYRLAQQLYSDSTLVPLIGTDNRKITNSNFQMSFIRNFTLFEESFTYNMGYLYEGINSIISSVNQYEDIERSQYFLSISQILSLTDEINYDYSLRIDYSNFSNPQYSLNTGISYVEHDFSSYLNFSKSFRYPSFFELYYYNFGNSNIQNESSYNLSLNSKYTIAKNIILSANPYLYFTNNKIVSLPISITSWQTENIDNFLSYGYNTNLSYNDSTFKFSISYTYNLSFDNNPNSYTFKKFQPYQPHHQFNSELMYLNDNYGLCMNFQYLGSRFSDFNNSESLKLNPNYLIDFKCFYNFSLFNSSYSLQFSVMNVLNQSYQIILNYPMAGRNYQFGVKATI